MTTELIFLLVSAFVAGLIVTAGFVAVLSARRLGHTEGGMLPVGPGPGMEPPVRDKYLSTTESTGSPLAWIGPNRFRATIRACWWATIAGVLIAVGVTNVYSESQTAIYALGALAVIAVVTFHEVIPDRWRTWIVSAAEVATAIALLGALVFLTGRASSPFAPLLTLPVLGVALGGRPAAGLSAAAAASLTFAVVLATGPDLPFAPGELLPAVVVLGVVWLGTVSAVVFAAQQRRLQAATLQISVTDSLTGLFNRAQIYVDLDQEVRRSRRSLRPFCLLMVDMDGLKAINDSLGHERGDAAIRGIASVIRRSIRTVDSAYRYAGDEFVVLLPETDFAGAFVVAEKVRQGAEELTAVVTREEAPTTVSIGLVSHPEDGSTDEELMLAVDRAMYMAKASGKNQVSGYGRPSKQSATSAGTVSRLSALG
ncbi:MAG TPA: GGDEF domain-containing protein [Candidatus Limnocylindria bacterium]|nr:GGDEF domain-containing protein [Candidatus Limnocylindria bacterium]